MNNEELQQQVNRLEKELNDLKALFFKDNYSNLQVFRKKVEFKNDTTLANLILTTLTTTGGTAPIADGNHDSVIPDAGATLRVATKNGIITAISVI